MIEKIKNVPLTMVVTDKMFDIEQLAQKEPDLFNDLCKDYPIEGNSMYMIKVKKG